VCEYNTAKQLTGEAEADFTDDGAYDLPGALLRSWIGAPGYRD